MPIFHVKCAELSPKQLAFIKADTQAEGEEQFKTGWRTVPEFSLKEITAEQFMSLMPYGEFVVIEGIEA